MEKDDAMMQWYIYFPGEQFSIEHEAVELINIFTEYFETKPEIVEPNWYLNHDRFTSGELAIKNPKKISTLLFEQPEMIINSIGISLSQLLQTNSLPSPSLSNQSFKKTEKIIPRIYNYPIIPFKHVKSNAIGKFISIKGTVIRVGPIKPIISR